MNFFRFCLSLLTVAVLCPRVHAAINVLDDWHMGESDPHAANGSYATNTLDAVGGDTLTNQPAGGIHPIYTNNVSGPAAFFAGSDLCEFYSGGQYAVGNVIPNLKTNFGLELWVHPTNNSGGQVIAYDGNTGGSGWGLYQSGTNCLIFFGGVAFSAKSAVLATNKWTDLALVCTNGMTALGITNVATLYTNGVPAFTMTNTPASPSGHFLIAADNSGSEDFSGAVDEVRVFTFAENQFSPTNLLVNGPLVVTNTADSGTGTLRDAVAAANSGNNNVTFAPNLSGQTITLTSGSILLNANVTLDASALPGGIQINGNGAFTVFNVASGVTAVLNALTITNGYTSGDGGGIYNGGTLTLNECTLSGNNVGSGGSGGGIDNASTAVLTLNKCSLSGNSSGNNGSGGGGLLNKGTATLYQCTLSGNNAGVDGNGGGMNNLGTGMVNQCTFAGNGAYIGGGIYNNSALTLNQCTLSGNTAVGQGNSSDSQGGGIYANYNSILLMTNTIVARNIATNGADIFVYDAAVTYGGQNLVQSVTNYDNGGTINGPAPLAGAPDLAPPGNYGGPTQTMPPLPGSPAIGAGSVAANTFTNDQRGYPRTQNGLMDIGAVELPTVAPDTVNTNSGAAPLTVQFNATNQDSDGSAIVGWNWSFGDGNSSTNQNPTNVYETGGMFLPGLIVTNSLGLTLAAPGQAIYAAPLVRSTADSGPGSLRSAIVNAFDEETITFATNLSGQTIPLARTLTINRSLTIDASALPGGIQINGKGAFTVFNVASGVTAVLNALTITNGYNSGDGGGIYTSGTLTLNDCALSGNQAIGIGGGIANEYGSTLTLNECIFSGNRADYGGGIANEYGSTLALNECTLSGNQANGYGGGGIYYDNEDDFDGNFMTLTNCTLSDNQATNGVGGGIYYDNESFNTTFMILDNCTLSGNQAESSGGGGICFNAGFGTSYMTLNNCTLSGNQAETSDGGGICIIGTSTPTLVNTIVAGNTASISNDIDGSISGRNNFIGGNPQLAPLGNYGGPTQTMPPLPGSPVIDAGDDSVTNFLATDQRGYPRLAGLQVDIGAVEGLSSAAIPFALTGATRMGNGSFQFGFTNYEDLSFTVYASTNLALPLNLWSKLGPAVEVPAGSGQFEFADPGTTNSPQRFYQVASP